MKLDIGTQDGYILAAVIRGPDFVIRESDMPHHNLHLELKMIFTARIRHILGVRYDMCDLRETALVHRAGLAQRYNAYAEAFPHRLEPVEHYLYHIRRALDVMMWIHSDAIAEIRLMRVLVERMLERQPEPITAAFEALVEYGESFS